MPKIKHAQGVVVKLKEIDEITFSKINRMILEIYSQKKMPTVMDVHQEVVKDESLPNYSFMTIVKMVKHVHFKFASRKMKMELVMRFRKALWYCKYIDKVEKLRGDGKFFYYIDEAVLKEGTTSMSPNDNGENNTNTKNKSKKLIACHIGSEEGFLDDGLLVVEEKKEMSVKTFEDWFKKILPKLKENSVIILDHADCHSRRAIETPYQLSPKSQICAWLDSHNISYDKEEPRVLLLGLVLKEKEKYVKFALDVIAAERNITVLRSPPYHCRLNPMQMIMYEIKDYFKNNTNYNIEETKNLLNEKLNEISLERWKELTDIAVKEEQWLSKLLYVMDDVTDDNIECMSSGDEEADDEYDEEYQDFVAVLADNRQQP